MIQHKETNFIPGVCFLQNCLRISS